MRYKHNYNRVREMINALSDRDNARLVRMRLQIIMAYDAFEAGSFQSTSSSGLASEMTHSGPSLLRLRGWSSTFYQAGHPMRDLHGW